MAMDRSGIMNGSRPNQPGGEAYRTPMIPVANLKHQGKYAGAPSAQGLPLALHHVIPWEVLWNFWNAMVRRKYYGAARDYLSLFGFAKARTKAWTDAMARGAFDDPSVGGIETNMCWWEWNLVRGPEHRTQASLGDTSSGTDPGAELDDMHFGAGKDGPRIKGLIAIGHVMKAQTRLLANSGSVAENVLSNTIRSWTATARAKIVEFEPAMWQVETKSPAFTQPGNHASPIHPRWNKVTREP